MKNFKSTELKISDPILTRTLSHALMYFYRIYDTVFIAAEDQLALIFHSVINNLQSYKLFDQLVSKTGSRDFDVRFFEVA